MTGYSFDLKREVDIWVSDTFKDKNFKTLRSEITGSSEKGDGYLGELVFVNVIAETHDEKTKEYKIVIKYGKQDPKIRQAVPIRLAFEREIFFYSKVTQIYQKFEEKSNVKLLDKFLVRCFKSLLYESKEFIALENLKAIGYELHDRLMPLNMDHLNLTFTSYGIWHGINLAFRDQYPEEFSKLFSNMESWFVAFKGTFMAMLIAVEKGLYEFLENQNEIDLATELRKKIPNGFAEAFYKLEVEEEPFSVFRHGDCWNNNFMYKYEGLDKSTPKSLKILDFQLAKLGSPVLDLVHHIYCTASENELSQVKDLLNVYYKSLSGTIRKLGSNPAKVFPYSELVKHWRRYSAYGFIISAIVLPITLTQGEDIADLQNINADLVKDVLKRQKNDSLLLPRLIATVKHFLEFDIFE